MHFHYRVSLGAFRHASFSRVDIAYDDPTPTLKIVDASLSRELRLKKFAS